ncbi:peptide chain release factor N(5)-glutamine methyltransferase [Ghiorsea bivora]|uniref:peptide chain release factor N(5)-glutamine methyltransferase n=1 Tax=Ghiorsea bivora TaxID=1485545 RepID=UPI00056DFAA0|nr:peptide chain release factor N(5)-glutamine methyltransferase [Ghiorsea bivora]
MNPRLLLQQSALQLEQTGVDAPRKDTELMLMEAWGVSATGLIIRANDEVPEVVIEKFNVMLKRRLNREPLAYILGKKAFWKHDFVVSKDVLVPRPETEHLIEIVLKYRPQQGESLQICDIGTGSGCIAVTLVDEYENSHVTACDISDAALSIARENAKQIGVYDRMTFYQGDLYQALPDGSKFDVIVSNPPYVSQDEMHDLEAELSFEPRFALTDESSGLTLLDTLLKDAHLYLKDNGLLVLESGLCGMPDTPNMLNKLEDYHDLAGNFRGSVFQMVETKT